jgi:hypothetical protein
MVENDRKQKKALGCASGLLVGIISLPCLYFFSYGPVIWLIYHDWMPFIGWVRFVYYPLHWLAKQNATFREMFVWWVQLWGG